jgi:2-hydroxychromene-2-carboxylate isomerase
MASPAGTIDFWFDFASTYSYLSAMRIEDAAADSGVTVRWRPFLLGPIFAAQGWTSSPFNLFPAKGRYMWQDMARLCTARGLALVRPPGFPQNGLRAARVALATLERPEGPAFCKAVFTAQFVDGRDISQDATIADCLMIAGLPATLLEQADDAGRKAALRAETEAAQAKGLFGAPSFTVGDAFFWGDDRLDMALDAARSAKD